MLGFYWRSFSGFKLLGYVLNVRLTGILRTLVHYGSSQIWYVGMDVGVSYLEI